MSQQPMLEKHWVRFQKNFVPVPESGCWLWTAGENGDGYGVFNVSGVKTKAAHRIAYEWLVGEIPKGLVIDHLCRVRCCVNPAHMRITTHLENIRAGEAPTIQIWKSSKCKRGHDLTGHNAIVRKDGWRRCRTCTNANYMVAYLKRHRRSA